MRRVWCDLALAFLIIIGNIPGYQSVAEAAKDDIQTHAWHASWIAHPEGPRREFGVFHFRKTLMLEVVPQHFVIHVSGDNRYELFLNGERVVVGPARGDLNYWRYETLDIAPHLVAGRNVLAAVVWNFAERAPVAQVSNETGLIVQGDSRTEEIVNSDASWKVYKNAAIHMMPQDEKNMGGYFAVGPGEQVDGSQYPWGWEKRDFDDSGWVAARPIAHGESRSITIYYTSPWMLTPRTIPLMEDKLERLARVVRTSAVEAPPEFLKGAAPVTLPANSHASLLLDQSYLTTGYPELVVSGGRGANITMTYSEALYKGNEKGNRNDTEGKEIRGAQDRFLPDGGDHRLFRPLWWRTFRYLQLDAETGPEPLTIEDLRSRFTAYPFRARASFESNDPELAKIWEVGWRTARLCAHETYMDCPYWEQLQYGGDTRIQALISLYMTGDDRLVKNAIETLNESRTPEGLTQSRYPTSIPQYIPEFSLFWIGMMHDLWWYRGDTDFLGNYLPGMRDVLGWFERRLRPSAMLGRLKWWNFVDWPGEFDDGRPPMDKDGQSSMLSLQFAAGLRSAADLEEAYGSKELAAHDRALAAKIAAAVYRLCWDPVRKLVADTPEHKTFSQHANILAVLADAVPAADQAAVIKTVLTDKSLTQATYYFRFYLFRATNKAGLGNEYLAQLAPWRHMLSLGLTTWAETPEPTRSDCHAWSAHPNFDLLATVAGIESAGPGFSKVTIQPHLGALRQLKATLPHPLGDITVAYRRDGSHLTADVTLPGKLRGTFVWKGKGVPLHPGTQHLDF
jgi:alpha-L-rhamnosidase